MTKLIKKLLIFINILGSLSLLMVKVGTLVSPNQWIFPSFFAYFITPLFILLIFFLFFWIILKKWWFLISFFSIIVFWGIITSSFSMHFGSTEIKNKEKKIKIITYNTMASQKMESVPSNKVLEYVIKQDADIVCLQEFATSENKNQFNQKELDRYFKKYPYRHIQYKLNRWNMHQGVATLSKYPIINKQRIAYDSKFNLSIYSDIVIGKDTIRVINNHLESNRITSQDMKTTADMAQKFDSEKFTDVTKYLSEKVSVASKMRALQAAKVADIRDKSPYKLIICGDFNDIPSSYAYSKVRGKLNDAFCKTKVGIGWTYNRSYFRFRIDYILYDDNFEATNYKTGNFRASDHYPIQAELYFKKKEISN